MLNREPAAGTFEWGAGEVASRKAEVVIRDTLGAGEAYWVERARVDAVRRLEVAVRAGPGPEERDFHRLRIGLPPGQAKVVEVALEVAGVLAGPAAPLWRRLEAIATEFLSSFPIDTKEPIAPRRRPSPPAAWAAPFRPPPPDVACGVPPVPGPPPDVACGVLRRAAGLPGGFARSAVAPPDVARGVPFVPAPPSDVACDARSARARARGLSPGEALVALALQFLRTWREEVERRIRAADRVLLRDGALCQVPGCSRPADHVHHLVPRAAGGALEPGNETSLCAVHHLRGVHGGNVRITGTAPSGLAFTLGEREVAAARA